MTAICERKRPVRTEKFLVRHPNGIGAQLVSNMTSELADGRLNPQPYLKEQFPDTHFVTLREILDKPNFPGNELFDLDVLRHGINVIEDRVGTYGDFHLPDFDRVLIGVDADNQAFYGGFHQMSLTGVPPGYRYIQDINVLSAAGKNSNQISPSMRSFEFIRAFAHDAIHYNSYRSFRPLEEGTDSNFGLSFYRFQYGLNFRRSNRISYSRPEDQTQDDARNLGTIMEGVGDRFGQEVAAQVADDLDIKPTTTEESIIFMEATGQLNDVHIAELENKILQIAMPEEKQRYFKNMINFYQSITHCYKTTLSRFDPHDLFFQEEAIRGILTGKFRRLVEGMGRDSSNNQLNFIEFFKSPSW